jgi:hypothetical protein
MLPLRALILNSSGWLLVCTSNRMTLLTIILWHECIWLRWVALILCIVLVYLCLRILWHGCLIRRGSVVVVLLATRRVLISISWEHDIFAYHQLTP